VKSVIRSVSGVLRTCCAYTLETMAFIERLWGIINSMATAMLLDKCLSTVYWEYAQKYRKMKCFYPTYRYDSTLGDRHADDTAIESAATPINSLEQCKYLECTNDLDPDNGSLYCVMRVGERRDELSSTGFCHSGFQGASVE
jgi:hypothetical protein